MGFSLRGHGQNGRPFPPFPVPRPPPIHDGPTTTTPLCQHLAFSSTGTNRLIRVEKSRQNLFLPAASSPGKRDGKKVGHDVLFVFLLLPIRTSLAFTLVFELRRPPENGGYAYFGWEAAYRRLVFMTRARRWAVLFFYTVSIALSGLLFYLSMFHCQLFSFGRKCPSTTLNRQRVFSEYLASAVACTIAGCSSCWLLANYRRIENSWLANYNFLEMPTAVLCSLLAGICGVVEIHYNFSANYANGYSWSDNWAIMTTDAVVLVFLHATLAFSLT